uniref:Uncharacterized protein n=1 Tax=Cacopsylla melanoneura TaxID=428564 RepID=A0A8D9E8U8_9HEMI
MRAFKLEFYVFKRQALKLVFLRMWHCKHFDNISFGKLSIAQINSVVCLKIILKYFTDRLHIDSTFLFTLIQTQAHHPWYCEFGNFITRIVRQSNWFAHTEILGTST